MFAASVDEDQIIARVAALDIGKAELVCCVRVPAPGGSKRRAQEVTTHTTMTRSLAELANRLVDLRVERVVMEARPADCSPSPACSSSFGRPQESARSSPGSTFRDAETLRRRAFGTYLVHPERVPADLLEVALLGINLPGTADTNQAIMQAVATIRGWRPQLRLEGALATLSVPTLFICGDHDPLAGPDVGRDLTTRMPDARLTVIPDAGHIPHLDQPEPVAAALNEFLAQPPH